eukprot:2932987-Prymnesium_polylepis.1
MAAVRTGAALSSLCSRASELQPQQVLATGSASRLLLCAAGESPVLVKAVRLPAAADAPEAARVRREIELASQDLGAFVVGLHGWLLTAHEAFLVLEYLPGGDLDLMLDRAVS